jgi:hypothetical protein
MPFTQPEKVMAGCPITRHPMELGFIMLPDQFARFDFVDLTVNCGLCGEVHSFGRRQLWLKPYEGPTPPDVIRRILRRP